MKFSFKAITLLVISILASVRLFATGESSLKLTASAVVSADETNGQTLIRGTMRCTTLIENVGTKDVQIILFPRATVTAKRVFYVAGLSRLRDGRLIKTSLYSYNPVVLHSGEVAQLPDGIFEFDAKTQGEIPNTVVYDVSPEFGETFGVWSGRIEVPIKFEGQPAAKKQ